MENGLELHELFGPGDPYRALLASMTADAFDQLFYPAKIYYDPHAKCKIVIMNCGTYIHAREWFLSGEKGSPQDFTFEAKLLGLDYDKTIERVLWIDRQRKKFIREKRHDMELIARVKSDYKKMKRKIPVKTWLWPRFCETFEGSFCKDLLSDFFSRTVMVKTRRMIPMRLDRVA